MILNNSAGGRRLKHIFLNNNEEYSKTEHIISRLLYDSKKEKLLTLNPLPEGFNSRIYKASTDKGSEYFVKKYITHNGDMRDRLSTEFNSFSFLRKNKVYEVPEPVCMNKEHNTGIYSFITGCKIHGKDILQEHVLQAVEFLKKLHDLKNAEGSSDLPDASEACFTIQAYMDSIDKRLSELKSIHINKDIVEELHVYLNNDFSPIYNEIKDFVDRKGREKSMDFSLELPETCKILSPSDFGFHNAIRQGDGTFVFVDFEYFGHDDPAKLISDFYLHPRNSLPCIHREFFFHRLYEYLNKDSNLVKRLPFIYLLLSLKWCLIMLNVFHMVHEEENPLCSGQLQKAKDKLDETVRDFKSKKFPLSLL